MTTAVDAAELTGSAPAPEGAGGRACLVVIYGPELGKRSALGAEIFEIGRSNK